MVQIREGRAAELQGTKADVIQRLIVCRPYNASLLFADYPSALLRQLAACHVMQLVVLLLQ